MSKIQKLLLGGALACPIALLPACATKPIVRTETVEVKVPVIVPVPAELTRPAREPKLPDGEITNEDMAEFAEQLKAALRDANSRLRKIAELGNSRAE